MFNAIWSEFLKIINDEVGSRIVETWFKAVSIYQWDSLEKTVYLKTPNNFVKDWLKNNYIKLLQEHLGRLLNTHSPKIIFINSSEEKNNLDKIIKPAIIPGSKKKFNIINNRYSKVCGNINSNYNFDNFVVGPNNSLACAASKAIAEKLGTLYNPLFIYGGSGLGKTHLLHAIANKIKRNKEKLIIYQTADRFISEFINAIRQDKVHRFKVKYQNIDVLLIDDIQFISNKEQTQEAFFHIFNSLYEAKKQLVFSSDTFPQNIKGLAERLKSRLQGGLITDIYMPSFETKIAILKKKSLINKDKIADEIINFIAAQNFSSIRELEGALVRIVAFSNLTQQSLSLELTKKVLSRTGKKTKKKSIELQDIATYVSKHYSYNINELISDSRNKNIVLARQVSMFLMKKLTNKSLREIGAFLNRKDHTTVLYALTKIEKLACKNKEFNKTLLKIEKSILN